MCKRHPPFHRPQSCIINSLLVSHYHLLHSCASCQEKGQPTISPSLVKMVEKRTSLANACSPKTACHTGQQVPVPVWRAGHWRSALREQGVQDAELASRMQEHFDQARIVLFQFEPGVKVSHLPIRKWISSGQEGRIGTVSP